VSPDGAADGSSPELSALFDRGGIAVGSRAELVRLYDLIADGIAGRHVATGKPLFVGLCGSQGSGKSTMALMLRAVIARRHGLSMAILSIDDVYLTRIERQRLAARVHPLLKTRGVPGTHDMALATCVIDRLMQAGPKALTALPAFDKARDDRAPAERWPMIEGRPDIILLEGWCVGAHPQDPASLVEPVNALEHTHDADGRWRAFVNDQLATPYRTLFDRLDMLIMLKAPAFESVFGWRREQERKLAATVGEGRGADEGHHVMDDAALRAFISHYERLTRHILAEMPGRADLTVALNEDRSVAGLIRGQSSGHEYSSLS
jgi:D-glycerate 3-kinase